MIDSKKHMLITYPIVLLLIAIDQVTKFLAVDKYFVLINDFISVHYSENTGAAWSILSGNIVLLAIISVLFLVVLVIFSHKFKEKSTFYSISYAFIVGGAIGNLIDRVFFGYVRDFIKTDFITFPIFNLADASLVFGVIMFSIYVLFVYPKISKEEDKAEKTENIKQEQNANEQDKTKKD